MGCVVHFKGNNAFEDEWPESAANNAFEGEREKELSILVLLGIT